MRFFEFDGVGGDVDKLRVLFNNLIGRATSKKQAAKYNWAAISALYKGPLTYQSFKAIYDSTPGIQGLIHDYNQDGIELNVPGAPDADKPQTNLDQSKAEVDKIAAGAAAKQLAQ
jgi:hypothetical protein